MNIPLLNKFILTGLSALLFAVLSYVVSRLVSKKETIETRQRRKILIYVRDTLSALFVALCLWIWYPQLKTVATTLAVIAVAVVIAFKEYLINITGFLFRTSARNFTIGDRIDLGEMRGDVVDTTIMGVSILEIGPGTNQYTGRTVFIPNSKFLSASVKNETRMKNYVFHVISFPLKSDEDWEKAEKILLDIAHEIVEPYVEEIRRHIQKITRNHSLDAPAVEPRIYIQVPEPDRINLVLRMPVPIQRRGRVEQEVIRKYLSRFRHSKEKTD
ncbi:mechanosensitive ion channel family protein [bacterium]